MAGKIELYKTPHNKWNRFKNGAFIWLCYSAVVQKFS